MANKWFDNVWAKSDGKTTLEMHTHHVITAGKNLLRNLSFTKEEKDYWTEKLLRCVVLHDLGKVHSEFQRRLHGAKDVSIRHEIVSLWFCENFLELPEDEMFAIATHHKGVIPHIQGRGRLEHDNLTYEIENAIQLDSELMSDQTLKSWMELMNLELPLKVSSSVERKISKTWIKILYGKYQSRIVPDINRRRKFSQMRSLLIASDHIGSARLENDVPTYKKINIKDFQPNKDGKVFQFRKFQKRLRKVRSDVVLHAPTGSGKTEAALSWVYANQQKNARLFYLLPYTASINAMVKRLKAVFGEAKVTALHSKTLDFFYSQLAEENSNNAGADYTKIEMEARSKKMLSAELFYPVKVATLHQILKTSLKGKGWELALYDYRNALFIIDEFHTYNALLTGMLLASIRLFRKIFNAKFFFMSATIPDFMLNNILEQIFEGDKSMLFRPDPGSKSDRGVLDQKRHTLYCEEGLSIHDKVPLIREYLDQGKSVLIVLNNVKTAQQLFIDIGFFGQGKVALLHGGFHSKSRSDIEERITGKDKNKRPQLLIATQAVEVSLDIDYEVGFIENAPIDALIQRLGRINRAGKKAVAPVHLFENIIGNTKFFYDEDVLKSTWKNLTAFNRKELSENDLVEVCNKVYQNGYNESQQRDFEQGLNNEIIENFEGDWIAGDWHNWIEDILERNNQKIEILCGNLVDEFDQLKKQKRYIDANRLLVQVYFYELKGTTHKKDEKRNVIVAYDFDYDHLVGYKKKEASTSVFL